MLDGKHADQRRWIVSRIKQIAKTITGHRTDSVFERYNITNAKDKREAQAKLSKYRKSRLEHTGAGR